MNKNNLLKLLGILFIILPYFFNTYSLLRLLFLLIGIFIFLLGCFLLKKINVLKIILYLLLLIITTYGIDLVLTYLGRTPIYAYQNKTDDRFFTYDSLIYRIFNCQEEKVFDFLYKMNYVCKTNLNEQDINSFLEKSSNNYNKYHNKFISIRGKVSEIKGNEYIYLQPFIQKTNGLVGELTFNKNLTLKVENNQENLKLYGNYEIYDNVIVTGKIVSKEKDTIIMHDVKIDKVNNFDNFSIEVKKSKDCKNDIKKLTTTDYNYYSDCLEYIHVIYDEFTVYDLLLSLETNKLNFEKWVSGVNKEENDLKELYKFKDYSLLKCKSTNTVLIGSSKLKLTSKFCDNIPKDK